jgi:N-formylglutamate deformylase
MAKLFQFRAGKFPLLVSIPHTGTDVPHPISESFTEQARKLVDTDWDLDRLYDLPILRDCSLIQARTSRYVIDLNRPKTDDNLYPGQNTTGLCPTVTFAGDIIYHAGREPSESEIETRIATYWQPYHSMISEELNRLRTAHGRVVLFDAHSIASEVPRLFAGRLPDFNFGTNRGQSCSVDFQSLVDQFAGNELSDFSSVINGRFIGGYITRHYGRPTKNVEALQLELSQATYMDEVSGKWSSEKATHVQQFLSKLLTRILEWLDQS